ncbi:GGDEF domain-containing protein [Rhizobium sp. XQZ8]|uniref:GGDEF domain-containing protein n=1 Tax=Rhizobium populisoli TaxID=2859785 RepID=UPI001C673BB2|nr:diguanylate cyclase [Rhizobium populisoli]MBW6425663.1 GGDEF domain-containing protein [Rhizobium populisoli]
MPDFLTLYLVVMLLNLSHCLMWGLIAYRYRDLRAARLWLAGSAASVAGRVALSLQGESGLMLNTVGGNGFIIFGFYLNWCGARCLHGDNVERTQVSYLLGSSVLVMAATFHLWYGRNPIYTLAQSLPLALTAIYLIRPSRRDLGAIIASTAIAMGALSHCIIAGGNILIVTGMRPDLHLYQAASIDLLVFLFAAVIWNFGFLICAFDRLQAKVEQLANEDELTGIANRRMLTEHLNRICGKQKGANFSLLLLDLDRFKAINDRYGHAAGDAALKHAAAVITKQLRQGDVFARLGGDEFCLLLRAATAAEATLIAKRIVSTVKATPFPWEALQLSLTVSIGIASSEGTQISPEALLDSADRALYETKRRGRDGYSVFALPLDHSNNIVRLDHFPASGSAVRS